MGLSTDLISQFAKITNDGIERKEEEVTLYGTITTREGDDSLYLRLDGSTELTPVVSSSMIEPGDRVSAVIKNHTAMVTGNFSDPSVGSGKVNMTIDQKYGAIFTGTEDGTTMINGAYIQTGTISVDSIDMKGAIDWSSLDDTVQGRINKGRQANEIALAIANGEDLTDIDSDIEATFIDGHIIRSPIIEGDIVQVRGTFRTRYPTKFDDDGVPTRWTTTGYMGSARGMDAEGEITEGVALAADWTSWSDEDYDGFNVSDIYLIVTEAGIRLQAGDNRIVITKDTINLFVEGGGKAYYNGSEIATMDDI